MAKVKIDSNTNIVILTVTIEHNSKIKDVRMALDTGATFVMIPWDVVEVLGLHPEISTERIDIVTASGVEKVPIVALGKISVAGKEAKNIKVIVHDLPPKSYVDGLLGLSFLRNFNLQINFREGYLKIE